MAVRRGLLTSLLCGLALVVAACGGGGGESEGSTLAGAEIVPADVPLFVSIDTDVDSAQWQAAQDLLDKFPGKERLLNKVKQELADEDVDFERDVRPVLGPEIGVAWLDIDDDDTFVGLMQPKDSAKLNALLEKGDDPSAHTEIDGWTVFAEEQAVLDRFRRASAGAKLSESDDYQDAVETLPEDALVRLYFGGPQVREAIGESLAEEGAPESFRPFADFRAASVAVIAEADGIRFAADVLGGSDSSFDTFEPRLPGRLPDGALFYLGYANLDEPARDLLEAFAKAEPSFEQQRRQAEKAFGFSIEDDVLPLLENEGAFAIYPGRPLPTFVYAIAGDEEKAVTLMDRLGALLALSGGGRGREQQLEGVTVKEVKVEGFSIFYAALDGLFIASNTREGVLEANRGGPKLADDALYQAAREGAEAEGGTIGFLYGNLQEGLPYVFDFVEDQGQDVPQVARDNVEPLRSFLFSGTQNDDRFELSGFVGIE